MNELTNKYAINWNLLDQQLDNTIYFDSHILNTPNTEYIHSSAEQDIFEIRDTVAVNIISEITIPISILKNNSSMQSIVHYLKSKNYSFKEIALMLSRDQRTIWCIYNKKKPLHNSEIIAEYTIPVIIFRNRNLSVLENIVLYLQLEYSLEISEIAALLGKNYRTIWTICQRIKTKNKQQARNES